MTLDTVPYCVSETRTKLVVKHVFFSVILYERCKLICVDNETPWRGQIVPTACTDGRHIVINTDFFDTLTLDERVFVLAHEVYHAMAMHPTRMKHYAVNGLFNCAFSSELYNIAADAVINKCLIDDGIGTKPKNAVLFPDPIEHEDGRRYQITGRETPEDVYEYLMRSKPPQGSGDGYGDDDGSGGGQEIVDGQGGSGKAERDIKEPDTQTESEISETEMKASIQSAVNQAKSQGQLPAGLQQFIDEFLEPEVDWTEQLRTAVVKRSQPDSYTWSKPHRRKLLQGMVVPRRVGTTCGHVVCAIDTSGSVSDMELRAFLGEMSCILGDVHPEKMTVIWCDARVDRVDEITEPEELRELTRAEGVPGRGGTAFHPPFEYAAEHIEYPAFFIYLTDGYAPFDGTEGVVDCPVIWVMSSPVEAPHGETIQIDVTGRV
jgi:predicted metal-dependent peptidase